MELAKEDKEAFVLALRQAVKALTDGDTPSALVAAAKAKGPDAAAVDFVVPLLQSIHAAALKAGVDLRTDIVVAVGIHCVRIIAELFVMSGLMRESDVQGFARNVTQMAIKRHNSQFGGQT